MNCHNCGAPVPKNSLKCGYCGTEFERKPLPPPPRKVITGNGGIYRSLQNTHLKGNGNIIKKAVNSVIEGNGNIIKRIDDKSEVIGNGNVVKGRP